MANCISVLSLSLNLSRLLPREGHFRDNIHVNFCVLYLSSSLSHGAHFRDGIHGHFCFSLCLPHGMGGGHFRGAGKFCRIRILVL